MMYVLGTFSIDGKDYHGCSIFRFDYNTAMKYATAYNKCFRNAVKPTQVFLIPVGRLVEFEGVDKDPECVLY